MTDFAEVHQRDHFVYRAYDEAGRLLYVGCSYDPVKRIKDHKNTRAKWRPLMTHYTVDGPHSYLRARDLEWEAIQTEGALFNGQTPKAHGLRLARRRFVDSFIQIAMAHGEAFNDAVSQAVKAADVEFEEDEVA